VTIERFMPARAAVYGASSVERLSVEKAIAEQVRRFKSILR
jgi:predicted TIM-barrel enzyme